MSWLWQVGTVTPVPTPTPSPEPVPSPEVLEPPPAPVYVTVASSPVYTTYAPGSIEALVASYSWDTLTAFCIVQRESNWDPMAVNPWSGTVGLFQIRPSVHAWRWEARGWTYEDMMTAGPNIEIAWELYSEQGWAPWNGSPQCWN